ncbi:MAG: single-stranded DNA-binding protein [Pseudomonadota bacterium]
MASFNKVILLGNAGKDPEVRYLPNGDALARLSLATTQRHKDKTSGETKELTQWHRLTFYGRNAEIAGEYIKKGSPVHVEGALKYGSYEKDGVTHYTTEIIVSSLQLLGPKPEGSQRPASSTATAPQATRPQANSYAEAKGRSAPRQASATPQQQQRSSSGFDDMDDDIPF